MASDHTAVSYEPSHSSLSSSFQTHLFRDNDERSHWAEVCSAFRHYADFAFCHWDNQRHRIGALPESQQKLLPKGLRPDTFEGQVRFHKYQEAVMANQYFLDCILRHSAGSMSHFSPQTSPSSITRPMMIASDDQFSKVSSVLKSLARDWSLDGKLERDMAYGPILKKVKEYVPILDSRNYVPRICIPGAGVGRGMCDPENPLTLSPWLLESRNLHSSSDAMRKVSIPDVVVGLHDGNRLPDDFSMAAGDFISIYGHLQEASQWDSVVCCFFLDALPNIVECIKSYITC